jgi:hypothetical protein
LAVTPGLGGSEVCNLHTDMSKIALPMEVAKKLAGVAENGRLDSRGCLVLPAAVGRLVPPALYIFVFARFGAG